MTYLLKRKLTKDDDPFYFSENEKVCVIQKFQNDFEVEEYLNKRRGNFQGLEIYKVEEYILGPQAIIKKYKLKKEILC